MLLLFSAVSYYATVILSSCVLEAHSLAGCLRVPGVTIMPVIKAMYLEVQRRWGWGLGWWGAVLEGFMEEEAPLLRGCGFSLCPLALCSHGRRAGREAGRCSG